MACYIAFLRAINVGGHIVKMEPLRSLFEALGFERVATFIASGNVIFESPREDTAALEAQIEAHLERSLGFKVGTFLRVATEMPSIAEHQPFLAAGFDAEAHALWIGFLKAPLEPQVQQRLMGLGTPDDDFHVRGRELYWWCRTRVSDSKVSGALIEKTLGMPATFRNVTTVRKLAAKYVVPG